MKINGKDSRPSLSKKKVGLLAWGYAMLICLNENEIWYRAIPRS